MDDNPFNKKYETIRILGQGAQGLVELCKKKNTNQLFAVKKTTGDLVQLQKEIDIQSSVGSKYIVKMIEVISYQSFIYIVLEYCNGGTLWGKARNNSFSEAEIYEFLKFILGAQYELIQMGIIHRDLKLDNILIHDGQYKLADFGISRVVHNIEQQRHLTQFQISTYRSPQMESGKYTSKCDVWSLGIIIFYLLFKKYPWNFDQNNRQQYYYDCSNLTYPQSRAISEEMKELIKGCLAYEEKDRFSWTDLMKTKNLGFQFDDYVKLEYKLKHIENQLAQKIILEINKNNLSVKEQFEADNRDNAPLYRVRFVDFHKSVRKYDQKMEQFHIVYIFNSIDQKHQNYIDNQQFEKWIDKCNEVESIIESLQDEFYPPLHRIYNNNDRLKMKYLFIIIYFQIQQEDHNIQRLVDRHENIIQNRKMGFILASEFVNLFKHIDQKITQDYIQIAKKYLSLLYQQYIKNEVLVQYYQSFQEVNQLELSIIYQLLNFYQAMKIGQEQVFEGYLHFTKLFNIQIIDRFVSLDLKNDRIQQNNLEDLNNEVKRIKEEFNIQY